MAKQNRNDWFDTINHLPLTSTTPATKTVMSDANEPDIPPTEVQAISVPIGEIQGNNEIQENDGQVGPTVQSPDKIKDTVIDNPTDDLIEEATPTNLIITDATHADALEPKVVPSIYKKKVKRSSSNNKKSRKDNSHRNIKIRKNSKKDTTEKNKYITARLSSEPYKKLISLYPLMNKTTLLDEVVNMFLATPKKETDQWLKDNCGSLEKY